MIDKEELYICWKCRSSFWKEDLEDGQYAEYYSRSPNRCPHCGSFEWKKIVKEASQEDINIKKGIIEVVVCLNEKEVKFITNSLFEKFQFIQIADRMIFSDHTLCTLIFAKEDNNNIKKEEVRKEND